MLAESKRPLRATSGLVAVGAALSLAVVSAVAMVPGQSKTASPVKLILEPLSIAPHVLPSDFGQPYTRIERIRFGDTLGSILSRLETSSADVVDAVARAEGGASALRNLRAGRAIQARIDGEGLLHSIDIPTSDGEVFSLTRQGGELLPTPDLASSGTITRMSSGTIESSLFAAADEAGLPDAATMKLAEIFGTEIDFHSDLRKGDTFSVLYEARTRNGSVVGVERILAAEFVNKGKRYAVLNFEDEDGNSSFFTPDGQNLKQAFLRSPLEFSRVTSGFKMRFHPIQREWKRHTGVDFGAATGTAIKATSSGRVDFVGSKSGYGNTVILRHRNSISTLYAHMSRFASGVRVGQLVSQGDIIGYVGSTGWATGPHLHYEFRKADQPVDPMTVALPAAEPLEAKERKRFFAMAEGRLAQLAILNRGLALSTAD